MSGELDRTRIHLEESLGENREMQAKVRRLQDELECNSSRASHLENELVRVTGGIAKAMQVLQVHQAQERSMSDSYGDRQDKSGDGIDSTVLGTPAPIRDGSS
ncbi:hypothetical protein HAV15_001099 [Penicillium sp. str. |nr:hypothetical protein HAV15_001099 [Penicillium sp. str. \